MTKNVWVNASAFLRIRQDDLAADLGRDTEADEDPDVLDDTRIHPEDYDVARKMAADAMEYDEEDLVEGVPSKAVVDLLEDDVRKLNDLALDEFAEELSKVLQQPKRLTLYRIREELQKPFGEKRQAFEPPNDAERFTMFTGETKATLDEGFIIPVRVLRVAAEEKVITRLDCGIEGTIASEFRTDASHYAKLRPGQTLQAVVIGVLHREMRVELTTQEGLLAAGDAQRRQVRPDTYFDGAKAQQAAKAAGQEKQKATGRVKRMINHPNFQDVSSGKAEELLSNMQRGDCVIRPSSREDHLAVTWKVDEGLYQHIGASFPSSSSFLFLRTDRSPHLFFLPPLPSTFSPLPTAVHELNKPSEYALGTQLRISDKHRYSDLDELIDAHIKQMSRKVTEMTNNEKFKGKKEALGASLHLSPPLSGEPDGFKTASRQVPPELDPCEPWQVDLRFRMGRQPPQAGRPLARVPNEREGADSVLGAFRLPAALPPLSSCETES
jgi:transcription elongation factor SPT6